MCHGGLTYSCNSCPPERIHEINAEFEPEENTDVWWFGFDCAHYGDFCPGNTFGILGRETYKNIHYVEMDVAQLAAQLAEISRASSSKMKYRSIPKTVEAVRYVGRNEKGNHEWSDSPDWLKRALEKQWVDEGAITDSVVPGDGALSITFYGQMYRIYPGHWVILQPDGTISACTHTFFRENYIPEEGE